MSFTKFVPGVGNVEDIQEELNGMLFGNDSSQEVASSSTSPPTTTAPITASKEVKAPFVPR